MIYDSLTKIMIMIRNCPVFLCFEAAWALIIDRSSHLLCKPPGAGVKR